MARKRYYLIRLGILLGTTALGTLAGYLVGREAILYVLDSRLGEFVEQAEQREEELAAEVDRTLSQANASPFAACSAQDIALLRRLTFVARFLKDVGRLRNNELVCSAAIGMLTKPGPMLKPDFQGPSGTMVYRSYPLYQPAGDRAEMFAYRNAEVVVSPDAFSEFPQSLFHFSAGIVDSARGVLESSHWPALPFPLALLREPNEVQQGDTLYRAKFSPLYPVGAVAYIRIAEIWKESGRLLLGYTLTGTAAGMASGMVLFHAGRKRSSPSSQLRRAVLTGNLSVAYQPIVDLSSNRIIGAEALARWIDEDGDSIRPEILVALAEADGFVGDVTRFVVTRALDEMRPTMESDPAFRLSINLAPQDLADPRLLILLDEKLQDGAITPANIAFELPERATSNREVAIAAIHRLRERGHAIFIDDFGTGFSNLTYLSELNVDGIKINRSFIATIGTESVTATIVPQILAVAKALDLSVVVQGIEREEQVRFFANGDGILGQGWFLGLPISARSLRYLCAEKTE